MSVGALNSGVIQQLVFDSQDISKMLAGQPAEAGAFAQTAARLGAGAERIGELGGF